MYQSYHFCYVLRKRSGQTQKEEWKPQICVITNFMIYHHHPHKTLHVKKENHMQKVSLMSKAFPSNNLNLVQSPQFSIACGNHSPNRCHVGKQHITLTIQHPSILITLFGLLMLQNHNSVLYLICHDDPTVLCCIQMKLHNSVTFTVLLRVFSLVCMELTLLTDDFSTGVLCRDGDSAGGALVCFL